MGNRYKAASLARFPIFCNQRFSVLLLVYCLLCPFLLFPDFCFPVRLSAALEIFEENELEPAAMPMGDGWFSLHGKSLGRRGIGTVFDLCDSPSHSDGKCWGDVIQLPVFSWRSSMRG
jgi:hypothetical protein